jgi:FKBP-type peptidyl-prolyl cis-trans isomerase 2
MPVLTVVFRSGYSNMDYRSKMFFTTVFFVSTLLISYCPDTFAAEAAVIRPGDRVGILFTCRFPNGEIAGSTSSAVAADSSLRKSPVYLPRSKDDPIEVVAGPISGQRRFPVPFLDEIAARISAAIPGMQPGETRTMEIRSERPAGVPEKDQFLQLARIRPRPKEIRMTREEYKSRTRKEPQVGAEYLIDHEFPTSVVSVSENEVVIRPAVKPGSVIDTTFGKATVRENGDQLEIVFDAVVGTLVRMGTIVGRISDAQDKLFTVDFGHPFAGEPLSCEVKAVEITGDKPSRGEK